MEVSANLSQIDILKKRAKDLGISFQNICQDQGILIVSK